MHHNFLSSLPPHDNGIDNNYLQFFLRDWGSERSKVTCSRWPYGFSEYPRDGCFLLRQGQGLVSDLTYSLLLCFWLLFPPPFS